MIKEIKNTDKDPVTRQQNWASHALIINKKGKIKFITQALAKKLGYSVSELLGKDSIKKFITEDDREEKRSQLSFLYKQDSLLDKFDLTIQSKASKSLQFRFSILKILSSDGKPDDIALIGDDLSLVKKTKLSLPDEVEQLEQLIDRAQEFIIVIDHKEKIQSLNEVSKKVLGFKKGMSLRNLLDPVTAKNTSSFLSTLGKISSTANINLALLHPATKQKFYLKGSVSSVVRNTNLIDFRLILHDVTERTKTEKAKDLYYSIAHHSIHSKSLNELYYNIHKELKAVVDCDNLYIALMDIENGEKTISFPYYQEGELPYPFRDKRKFGNGVTEHLIDSAKPQLLTKKDLLKLTKENKINLHGTVPEVWLGVPLKVKSEVIGAIAVQSYHSKSFYTSRDLKLLDFASSQIAMAINMVRTQEKLVLQTAKLNSIIESGSHLIWTVNKKLELTSYNQNYLDTIVDNYDILPTIQEGALRRKREFPLLWQKNYHRALQGEQVNFEIKLKNSKGEDIWKEIYLNPIFLEGNKIEEISGIANDITEKKKSQEALVESEEKFRNIFESFQDVYFRCNRNGIVNLVSPSIKSITGRSVRWVIGKNILSFVANKGSLTSLLKQLLRDKEIKNVEATVKDVNGNLVECICNLRLLTDIKSGEAMIEGVVRDVTLLKLTNKELTEAKNLAEKSLMVKEQFLANMSHEIRTPLNGIIGVVDLLELTQLAKDQTSYLQTIKTSSETLLNILNDILDLSKIEAGKMELRRVPLSFNALVQKIDALFASRAASNLINLNFHISKNIPEVIEADGMRVIQVISNLLANSIKFTPRGGSIDIGFEIKETTKKNVVIRVDVRDSGIGIKNKDIQKLFTNFTQLDTSTTKSYGGTGLGLAISKQLVELMGGQIGVSSSPGLGSTFWFTFVAELTNAVVEANPIDNKQKNELSSFTDIKPKILVVDDNLVNRDVAGEILKKCGCIVDVASNGVEAVYKAKSKHYDIIFMDIQMPEMDGIEANRQIKKLQKKKPPVVVAMTAYSMKEDEQRFLDAGLDDYIAKPLRASQLIAKVEEIIFGEVSQPIIEPSKSNKLEIVNTDILNQLKKYGGNEMLYSSLKEFEEEAKAQLLECQNALASHDYNLIKKHLHTLKGSAGTLGIDRVADQSIQIEAQLKKDDYSSLKKGLYDLNASFVEFQENFTNIISNY